MVSIAILGNGVVGSGLVELIEKNKKESGEENISITKILVKDKNKHKNSRLFSIITEDIKEVIKENVNIVVEAIGGIEPAYGYIKTFLKNKKHIVTANKDLISKHGDELLKIAKENNVKLYFEASVGGGIPILRPMKECLVGNNVKSIKAVLNGTTNFILTKMHKEGTTFKNALITAQELGFAEFDPTSDIKGYDSARKLAILSNLAYNKKFNWESFNVEGIDNIDEYDIDMANKLGGVIKLIGISEKFQEGIYTAVKPVIISKNSILSRVENEFNCIIIEGDSIGEVAFYGKGAGKLPTASAIYADIINIINNKKEKDLLFNDEKAVIFREFPKEKDWLIRISTEDRTEVICDINKLFKKVYIYSKNCFLKKEIFAIVYNEKEKDLKNKLDNIPNIKKLKATIILFHS
ncbi:homoserine dehydrogenase [Clostridium sporogenes]|uniref:homoserine dehydrogenase n=1 Tax=Clostridium sporogenes TaxID=1509 RepID=UPI0013C5D04A|nr:homoserine dehydrogenase [Clostridium sporogenes]MBW5456787.1 homoserine dehydrogenase [Clostridium sporogenes]NFT02933.1 homoserine dehydrogenase [Clostridium sporogenes]NFT32906.1 homoserine dehydrogenase [Clostridium sporogenes]NFT38439.1 homoserine dehydrogenase [Clostridium sporogenes]NFT75690.1 homoserine dehydrogenase [Clostridium sporogenes]